MSGPVHLKLIYTTIVQVRKGTMYSGCTKYMIVCTECIEICTVFVSVCTWYVIVHICTCTYHVMVCNGT